MKTIYPWLKNTHELKNTVDELLTLEAEASPLRFFQKSYTIIQCWSLRQRGEPVSQLTSLVKPALLR